MIGRGVSRGGPSLPAGRTGEPDSVTVTPDTGRPDVPSTTCPTISPVFDCDVSARGKTRLRKARSQKPETAVSETHRLAELLRLPSRDRDTVSTPEADDVAVIDAGVDAVDEAQV